MTTPGSPSADELIAGRGIARCLSVHDFVRVDLPFDAVVGAFAHFVNARMVNQLVLRAWADESSEVKRVVPDEAHEVDEPELSVSLGEQRARRGAVVLPIRWVAEAGWLPPLDADLEIVEFGPSRTHLHVLGLSQLRSEPGLAPERASLEHRLAVALVRHVLSGLAETITRASGWNLDRP